MAPGNMTFERYLEPDAPTVAIHGVVHGIDEGQVDFTSFEGDSPGEGRADAIHIQQFEGGTFDVTAPADFGRKLFVSACTLDEEGRPDTQGTMAALKEPLVIGEQDLSIVLELGTEHRVPGGVEPPPPLELTSEEEARAAEEAPAAPAAEAPAAEAPAAE